MSTMTLSQVRDEVAIAATRIGPNGCGQIEYATLVDMQLALNAELAKQAAEPVDRCRYCDGTGDVHRADGEWLGNCDCGSSQPKPEQAVGDGVVCDACGGCKYITRVSGPMTCWKCGGSGTITPRPAVAAPADVRKKIAAAIGFDFEPGELQTVNEADLLRLAEALTTPADGEAS